MHTIKGEKKTKKRKQKKRNNEQIILITIIIIKKLRKKSSLGKDLRVPRARRAAPIFDSAARTRSNRIAGFHLNVET